MVAQSQKESGSEATRGLADIFTITHNLSEEEPPGYLPLGYMIVCFCKLLSRKLNAVYRCHPQRVVARNGNPGKNPSTDVAIILQTLSEGRQYISKVLYEYKPRVHHRLDMVESKHLVELLLQCYYELKYEKQSDIMGCLTDLVTWHYIRLNRNEDGKLHGKCYCNLSMEMPPTQTEMSTQLLFLLEYYWQ